jgi:hypothetical protein
MDPRFSLWCLALFVACSVSASTSLAQEANQDAAKKEAAKQKAKLSRGGTYVGRIVAKEKDDVSFTLEVPIEILYWEVRPSAWDRSGQPTAIRRTVSVHRETQRLEVWLPDDVKVRVPTKPDFDAKGRPVPTNPKSDPSDPDRKLGGVAGSVEDLHKNQVVQVTLERDRAGHRFAKTILVLSERAKP